MLDIDKIQLELIINADPARKELYKLRETTRELEKEMKKIPKDTEEWNKKFDELKAANKRIEEINHTIGLTGMTSKELRTRLKEVKTMMDQFAQNTPQWKELNAEMKNIVARQKDIGQGAMKTHTAMTSMMGSIKSLLPALGLAALFSSLKSFFVSSAKAADEALISEKKLLTALGFRMNVYERLNKLAGELMIKYNIPDEVIRDAQVFLANQERTESQIRKTVQAAILLSNVTGEDLLSSTKKLDATYEGTIKGLARIDEGFKKLSKTQLENGAAVDLVLSKYADFTNKDVGLGKVKAMTVAWNEFKESMGKGEFPLINWVSDQLSKMIEGMGLLAKYGTWWKFGGDAKSNYFKAMNEDILHTVDVSKEVTRQMEIADSVTKKSGETFTEHYKNRLAQMLVQNKMYQENHALEIEALQKLVEMTDELDKSKVKEGQSLGTLKEKLTKLKTARDDINISDTQALIINQKQIETLEALIKKNEDLGKGTTTLGSTINELKNKLSKLQKQRGELNIADRNGLMINAQQIEALQNLIKYYEELDGAISKMKPKTSKKGVDPKASTLIGPVEEDNVIPGFPPEIKLRDQATAYLKIFQDTSLSQQEILKAMLDANLINYDQYYQAIDDLDKKSAWDNMDTQGKILYASQGVLSSLQSLNNARAKSFEAAMNRELKAATGNEAKQEAIRKEYAKKQNDLAVKQAYIAGALAIMQVWAGQGTGNFIVDTILKALATIAVVAITLEEVSLIKSNTYAEGNYADIIGAADGKKYRAKVADSKHKSGMFSEPTYVPGFGLFGETKQPELVFNPADTQKLINSPGLINAINATLGNGRQYANGNTREIIRESRTETFTDPVMLSAINRLNENIERGIQAKLIANEDYVDTHKKVISDHDTFLSKVNGG